MGGKQRRLAPEAYEGMFDAYVVEGLMELPETRVLVSCDDVDDDVILGWLCFAPGRVPTVHYAVVRGGENSCRRQGIFTVLLTAAGVRFGADGRDGGSFVYTFRPPDREPYGRRVDLEGDLVREGRARGVTAHYVPVRDYLRGV